jgi:hypothetical protein
MEHNAGTPSDTEHVKDAKKTSRLINRMRDHLALTPKEDLSTVERLALMTLATFANEDGSNAFPSQQTQAAILGKSERQARRILDRLAEKGELEIERHAGGKPGRTKRRPNLYRLLLPEVEAVENGSDDAWAEDADMSSDDVSATSGDGLPDIGVSGSYRTSGTGLPDIWVSADLPVFDLPVDNPRTTKTKLRHSRPTTSNARSEDDYDLGIEGEKLRDELREHFDHLGDETSTFWVQIVAKRVVEAADEYQLPLALSGLTHRLRNKRRLIAKGDLPLREPKVVTGIIDTMLGIWDRDQVWEGAFHQDMRAIWEQFVDSGPDEIYFEPEPFDEADWQDPREIYDGDGDGDFDAEDEDADTETAAWLAGEAVCDTGQRVPEASPSAIIEQPAPVAPAPKLSSEEQLAQLGAIRAANPGLVAKRHSKRSNVRTSGRKETAAA